VLTFGNLTFFTSFGFSFFILHSSFFIFIRTFAA